MSVPDTVVDSTAALDALLHKEAIRDVIHRFCRGSDRRDRDLVLSCFHPDGTNDHGFFSGSAVEFFDRPGPHPVAMHHAVCQIQIDLDGDVAHTESYCSAMVTLQTDDGLVTELEGVRYLDRFERRDGIWKIARRFVAFDVAVAVPGGIPERFPQRNHGTRDRTDPSYRLYVDAER